MPSKCYVQAGAPSRWFWFIEPMRKTRLPRLSHVRKLLLIVFAIALAMLALANGQNKRRVKPGDTVAVHCDEESAINKEYTITKDGFIIMPMVGALQVAGMTEAAAGAKIGTALVSEKIVPRATIAFKVESSKAGVISFTGAVKNSGELPPTAGLTLADVVKAAQPDSNANLSRVRIVTGAGNEFIVNFSAYDGNNSANNPQLIAGDSVFFDAVQGQAPTPITPTPTPITPPVQQPTPAPITPTPQNPVLQPIPQPAPAPASGSTKFITVIGAVVTPRNVPFTDGMTVSSAISAAGGLLKDSDPNVSVERKIDGNTRTYKENFSDVQKGYAGDMALRAGDVVNVSFQGHHHGISRNMKIGAAILLGLVLLHP